MNNNNDNVIIPDFMAKDLAKDIDNKVKKYGTSVFDYVPNEDFEEEENSFFDQSEFDKTEIENMRSEISKDSKTGKIQEKITTDAISGIKSSLPEEPLTMSDTIKELTNHLEVSDIKGKKITNYGRNLIKSLIGELPTEEEELNISSKIEQYIETIKNTGLERLDTDALEDFLSGRILDQLKAISDENSYRDMLIRFIQQIYIPYSNMVEYRDDISELNRVAAELDEMNIFTKNEEENKKNAFESLPDIQDKISSFINNMKNLDDRNSRLRQDYTINDIDTKLVESIGQSLERALSFSMVKEKVDFTANKFKKDLKKENDVNKSIDNWIHSIRHDSKTLFTFPCNDYLTDSESRVELVRYFYGSYIIDIFDKHWLTEMPISLDPDEYLIDNNIATEKELVKLRHKAWVVLYVISRTFKYNKIEENETNIRILSYTLDLISKMGIKEHRDKFIEISDYIYDKIFN